MRATLTAVRKHRAGGQLLPRHVLEEVAMPSTDDHFVLIGQISAESQRLMAYPDWHEIRVTIER